MADTDTELRVVIRAEFAQLRAAMDAMKRDTQSATDQAKLANVEQESMQTSLIALARTLTTNQAALERNKVEFKDLHGALLPLDQIFQNTIHRYGELKAGNDQAMFAVQVFKRAVGQMPE